MPTLGQRIRQARLAADLTQAELAGRIGIAPQSVVQWESGKNSPSRDNLMKAAKALDTPLQWLLYGGRDERKGNFSALVDEGGGVPMLSVEDAVAGRQPRPGAKRIRALFPCSADSWYFSLPNGSNEPEHPEGSIWIVDPTVKPGVGSMVVAWHGADRQPIFGRLRYETSSSGRTTVIEPLSPGWPQARSDLGPLEIIATMTESVRRGR